MSDMFQRRDGFRLLFGVGILSALLLVIAACQPIQPMADGGASSGAAAAPTMTGNADAGKYLVTLNGCGCHFNRDLGALAGGNKFEGDFGVVYASNLTPDAETGLGNWTEAQIADALLTGATPDGQLAPAMPYQYLSSVLTKQDAYDIAAYLLSQHALANALPANELAGDIPAFTPEKEAEPMTDPVARGGFLVAFSGCGRCHNPVDENRQPKPDMLLAGGNPVGDEVAANITPDEETGIGAWTEEQIVTFLKTGAEPDGEQIAGAMANVVNNKGKILTDGDAAAIAAYLKSIPAVSNDVGNE